MENLMEKLRSAQTEFKKQLAASAVSALYASFDVASLEEILAVGRKYEAVSDREEVLYMNEALAAEIERRKAIWSLGQKTTC